MFQEQMRTRQIPSIKIVIITSFIMMVFLLSGCNQPAEPCYQQPQADLAGALAYAGDDQYEFQFPLAELGEEMDYPIAIFCSGGGGGSVFQYHAAEDYYQPAGSPVYAFADGEISFSGPMGGYGWLIIIDHPQADIYSLYGHLSPSRWLLKSGSVKKGELIAYLGNSDENGGSIKNPLVPHLHFGVRAGQRTDYTGMGEWRWMAGWIEPCPSDLGWLNPSVVITGQAIPPGGFPKPEDGLFEKWSGEIILAFIYLFTGGAIFITSRKKRTPLPLMIYSCAMIAAGWYFSTKGTRVNYVIYSMAVLSFGIAIYLYVQRRKTGIVPDGKS